MWQTGHVDFSLPLEHRVEAKIIPDNIPEQARLGVTDGTTHLACRGTSHQGLFHRELCVLPLSSMPETRLPVAALSEHVACCFHLRVRATRLLDRLNRRYCLSFIYC